MSTLTNWNILPPVVVLATRALAIIGCRRGNTTCALVAEQLQHSLSYMEQLFFALKRARLVVGYKGPGGGYRLARPAEAISVGEIIDAFTDGSRQTLPAGLAECRDQCAAAIRSINLASIGA